MPFVARPAKSCMTISTKRLILVNCSSTRPTVSHTKQKIKAYFLPILSDTPPQAIWPTPPVIVKTTLAKAAEAAVYSPMLLRYNGSQNVIPVYIPTPIAEMIPAISTLGPKESVLQLQGSSPLPHPPDIRGRQILLCCVLDHRPIAP